MLVGGRVLPAAGGPPPRPRLHDPGPQPQSQAAHSGTSSGDLLNKERLPLFYLLFKNKLRSTRNNTFTVMQLYFCLNDGTYLQCLNLSCFI